MKISPDTKLGSEELRKILANGLTLQDNHLGGYVEITFGGAGAEQAVLHGMGFVPTGYIVVRQDRAGSIYAGVTPWTKENLYLASSAANLVARLFVL